MISCVVKTCLVILAILMRNFFVILIFIFSVVRLKVYLIKCTFNLINIISSLV